MKMLQKDYQFLKKAMFKVLKKYPTSSEEYKKAGLTEKRHRWDIFAVTGIVIGDGKGIDGDINLYSYLNDIHVDTAFKKIIREFKKNHLTTHNN